MEHTLSLPAPTDFDGYWFIELNKKHGLLLVARVESPTWMQQLGELDMMDTRPNIYHCTVGGKHHIALSISVGSYGPGIPNWVAHIRRHPDWPIQAREDWFTDKVMELAR